ncbi:MAG: hypothetical protein Q9174_006095 [Haloplaca sp. 1 TL-2023]
MARLSFPADCLQQGTTHGAENNASKMTPTVPSIWITDQTPDQVIASKLLPYIRATIAGSARAITSRFMSPTVDTTVNLVQGEHSGYDGNASPLPASTKDKLLAASLDLFAMVQVIVSNSDDWSFSTGSLDNTSMGQPPSPSMDALSDPFVSTDLVRQLQAAAEQEASVLSKNIMIELEKRLERKEKCQGFETFLVGIILLNCVEKMSWALQSLHYSGSWPLDEPVDRFLNQAAQFAVFLSKLYKMRGILLHAYPDADDGLLRTSPSFSPEASKWVKEMRITCKLKPIYLTLVAMQESAKH